MSVCIVMRFPKKSIELWSAGAGNPGLYSDRTKSAAKAFVRSYKFDYRRNRSLEMEGIHQESDRLCR